jgi:hypothetical protein
MNKITIKNRLLSKEDQKFLEEWVNKNPYNLKTYQYFKKKRYSDKYILSILNLPKYPLSTICS